MKKMCQHCGKNEATFYYKSNINGKVTEAALCPECVHELGIEESWKKSLWDDPFFDFPEFRWGFGLPSFLDAWEKPLLSLVTGEPSVSEDKKEEAKEEKTEHPMAERWRDLRELNSLKAELRKAVREEDFERAITLRDQIRQREGRKSA